MSKYQKTYNNIDTFLSIYNIASDSVKHKQERFCMPATPVGDIIVITHNGKPVSEGGKRLGYQVKDVVFMIGGGTYSASALLAQQRRAEEAARIASLKAKGILIFAEIPRSFQWSNSCPNCGSYSTESMRLQTDQGTTWGYGCISCNTKFLAKE